MAENGTVAFVDHLPECDFRNQVVVDGVMPACAGDERYDAATIMGPWANMCPAHFKRFARHPYSLGIGKGQQLKVREAPQPSPVAWSMSEWDAAWYRNASPAEREAWELQQSIARHPAGKGRVQ